MERIVKIHVEKLPEGLYPSYLLQGASILKWSGQTGL